METQPTDGKLTSIERDQVLDALKEIQRKEQISGNTLRRVMGCSHSVWSQISRGVYRGDSDKYLLRGRQWMIERASRQEAPASGYAPTHVGNMVMAVCQQAWEVPCIGLVVTPSGAGKTAALREFARRRGERALYIQAGEAYCSKQGLILEIAHRLGVKDTTRSTSARLYRSIRDKLADYYAGGEGSPFCLLIDEATTLRPSALNVLRNLHDDDACRVALVLADTARLDAELSSRAGIAGGYEQLKSRLGAKFLMAADAAIPAKDVKAVIENVLTSLGFTGRLDRHALDYLCQIAQAPGKLRNVVYRLHAGWRLARMAEARATFSVTELDYAAGLVGAKRLFPNTAPAFAGGEGDPTQASSAKKAG